LKTEYRKYGSEATIVEKVTEKEIEGRKFEE
jgi:hypothetical protein